MPKLIIPPPLLFLPKAVFLNLPDLYFLLELFKKPLVYSFFIYLFLMFKKSEANIYEPDNNHYNY